MEKSCENCRYFAQHYVKERAGYHAAKCGRCTNINRKKLNPVLCERWADNTVKKEERKKAIKDILEFMSDRLDEIAAVLKDDKD